MIKQLFHNIGVDWTQFKALLVTGIMIEFRESRGRGGRRSRKISPLLGSLFFYSSMGLILSANLVGKANPFFYSFLFLAYSMVMSGFSVIIEFGNSILNPDDWDVLKHRPINSRTYFFAKLSNLLFYIFVITTAMCFLPSLLGIAVKGNTVLFPLIFFPVCLIANIAAASFVVFAYTLILRKIGYQKFKDMIAYLQIGFSLALFLSYQFVPRLSRDFFITGEQNFRDWFYIVPPAWFAGITKIFLGQGTVFDLYLACIGISVTVGLIFFSFRKISLQYAGLIGNMKIESASHRGSKMERVIKYKEIFIFRYIRKFLKNPEMAAGFDLTSAMIKHDRSIKMGIYPLLGIPIAFLILALVENQFVDPVVHSLFSGQKQYMVMFTMFIFMMMYSLIMHMKFSNDYKGGWIFKTAPIVSPGRFYQGVKLALLIRFIIPFFVVLTVIYLFKIPLLHTLQYVTSLFLFNMLFSSAVLFLIDSYPFSVKRQKGERIQRFAFIIFVVPVFVIYGTMQLFIYNSLPGWFATQVIIIILWRLCEYGAVHRLDKKLNQPV